MTFRAPAVLGIRPHLLDPVAQIRNFILELIQTTDGICCVSG
jgi:hypothetical protein